MSVRTLTFCHPNCVMTENRSYLFISSTCATQSSLARTHWKTRSSKYHFSSSYFGLMKIWYLGVIWYLTLYFFNFITKSGHLSSVIVTDQVLFTCKSARLMMGFLQGMQKEAATLKVLFWWQWLNTFQFDSKLKRIRLDDDFDIVPDYSHSICGLWIEVARRTKCAS